ncbi:proline--tRNA ligase 1 [Weizmannia acidilactici]|uniref:Proline--tRNA ligase n=1 Tax=Weizmannia acidilactici TaxID=2607726 RepID=A0A5J4JB77_9BACI|nr:proline--tRNA ligase [Weizmannia acidilactici]GER65659.1 proline--tRNA ligase 1 [Weizmannia acidilactici]GER69011.1 proline--tRNA ligase 1 [Weizmannia acidilactici]GER72016.1 proline--tRNA ligase 1 [Weizmannia acidilactici]
MRQSKMFIPTLRDVPADAEIKSHQLLLRAGYIRQVASGVYTYLPLARNVLHKIETIIREEMEAIGSMELLMPALQPAELWQESGRWYSYGPELMRLKDRHERDFALGPTHEEVITSLIRGEIKSYKRLPLSLYQIQTKFRDEKRPRFGLLRGREFVMKDAYSFHADQESLDETYNDMYRAYSNIFSRCKLDFRAVLADSGAIGGKDTQEFMVLSEIGEDTIAYSDASDYAANIEMAEVKTVYTKPDKPEKPLEKIPTPGQKTIAQIVDFLKADPVQCLKTLVLKADDEYVIVLVRGDHEVNEIKVKNLLGAETIEMADPEIIKTLMGADIGSLGPVGAPENIRILADNAVQYVVNGICGANENDYHYINANPGRDYRVDLYGDLRNIQEGDPSPDGKGTIRFARGIEVGHIFKLGTKYSEAMHAAFLDENGREQVILMGCYGIGVSRTLMAVCEQHNDDKGLVWPVNLAPFEVHLVPVNMKDEKQAGLTEKLYTELQKQFTVLMDDRNERPGVKFADSDLIGLPTRVTVGKKASEGIVEIKVRKTGEVLEVKQEDLSGTIANILAKLA